MATNFKKVDQSWLVIAPRKEIRLFEFKKLFIPGLIERLQQQLTSYLRIGFTTSEACHLAHHPLEDGLFPCQIGGNFFGIIIQDLGHNPFKIAFVGNLGKVLSFHNSFGACPVWNISFRTSLALLSLMTFVLTISTN